MKVRIWGDYAYINETDDGRYGEVLELEPDKVKEMLRTKLAIYIDDNVRIGKDVAIGTYTVIKFSTDIENNVKIGQEVLIENSCSIWSGTEIGMRSIIRIQCCIKKDVIIGSEVIISQSCIVGSGVTISANSHIGNDTVINDQAFIGHSCCFMGKNMIGENSCIHPQTVLGTRAKVPPGYELDKSIYINGSQHPLTVTDRINIGCIYKHPVYLLEELQELGVEHDYTSKQRTEYKRYIKLAERFIEQRKKDGE